MVHQVKFGIADRMKEDGLKFADSYYGEMAHYGLYRNCENADLTEKKNKYNSQPFKAKKGRKP